MQWKLGFAAAILLGAVASANAAKIKITIKGFKFSPAAVTAHVGNTIEWINQDSMAHTATDKAKAFDLPVPAGKSASLKLDKAGTFDYFCKIHPSMTGKITVE